MVKRLGLILSLIVVLTLACSPRASSAPAAGPVILASATFLADIARNVAGSRLTVESILPVGIDPHSYQAVPADVAKISKSSVLIVNGVKYEQFLEPLIENAGGRKTIIEAAAGLELRTEAEMEHGMDPHLWLDPNNVIVYVQNIRDGLIRADPEGETIYRSNADTYIEKLRELDAWIVEQVSMIPPERRLLATNHEALGYFADRYGFQIVGTVLKSVSSEASVSAQELGRVIDEIKATDAPAIFLDEAENKNLAEQIAEETGVVVVDDLHLESLTEGAPAATYIDMMKHNVARIVQALK